MKNSFKKITILLSLISLIVFTNISTDDGEMSLVHGLNAKSESLSFWTFINESQFSLQGERKIVPEKYEVVRLDFLTMKRELSHAPKENTNRQMIIDLPKPDGTFEKFSIASYEMMEPGLAERYPDIKTFTVKGISDPYATGTIDYTHHGFHALILSPNGDYSIDPFSSNDITNYITYFKKDLREEVMFECLVSDDRDETIKGFDQLDNSNVVKLRTYRLACAATGEYTLFHGGTVADGMAGIVTTLNRVNGIYQRDLSIRLLLISNNDQIVYTDPETDPYTNNSIDSLSIQNQRNLDQVIGDANYDIGHVFGQGSNNGRGHIRSVCSTGIKARGFTKNTEPVGDPFDVDYVSHEIGHQFGGLHTQNNACNRTDISAWEPGSGSTIMGYAGVCQPNLQNNSDAYFHSGNISQILTFVSTGTGSNCAVEINSGNLPPIVTVPQSGFTIPANTPFKLTGSATDPQNDPMTFCWEQFDLGPSTHPDTPSGNAPIFRSWTPSTSPTRYFPRLEDLVNNTTVLGEILPTYSRDLTFRLTVRDNYEEGGGVTIDSVKFSINQNAGPFKVTYPDTYVEINTSSHLTVNWNTANTNAHPVNCNFVNIKLSTNGGLDYPVTLGSELPNNGSATFKLPNIASDAARIMVEAADNIFFDISDENFKLISHSMGMVDLSFNPGNSSGGELIKVIKPLPDGKILIGGHFSEFNGVLVNRIARLNDNSSTDQTFSIGSGANGVVNTIEVLPDGKILIAGWFTQFNGVLRNGVARLNHDGTLDNTFNPGTGIGGAPPVGVDAMLVQPDGKIVLGGSFTSYNGSPRNNIVRINSEGSLDQGFVIGNGIQGIVLSMLLDEHGKIIVGGSFSSYNGHQRNSIVRINFNGSIDIVFDPGTGPIGPIYTMAFQEEKILIGGSFFMYNGTPINRIARLHPSGILDMSFSVGSGFNDAVRKIIVDQSGKLFVGGWFTEYNGVNRNYFVRLLSHGDIENTSFIHGSGGDNYIYEIALQDDNKILISGLFISFNGESRKYIVRLFGEGSTNIVNSNNEIPENINLSQNYPNPFNPETKINFHLPESDLVTLKVYDMTGREVSTLVNGFVDAGKHTVNFNGSTLSSGVYFYRLVTNQSVITKRMVLVK